MRLDAALARSRGAFGTPALALLHRKEGPLVVALLSLIFSPGRATVPTEQMHVEVEDLLAEARAAGHDDVPGDAARALCSRWVRDRWLVRALDDDGVEQYRVSSHAAEALAFVDRTQGARALVSESRIRTLLVALEGLARDTRPDRESQQRALREQIARSRDELATAEAELQRLEAGGPVVETPEDRLVEQFDNVAALVRELPADFARVAESIAELQRSIVTGLRQDDRPTGEVLGSYLDASDTLMQRTPEGARSPVRWSCCVTRSSSAGSTSGCVPCSHTLSPTRCPWSGVRRCGHSTRACSRPSTRCSTRRPGPPGPSRSSSPCTIRSVTASSTPPCARRPRRWPTGSRPPVGPLAWSRCAGWSVPVSGGSARSSTTCGPRPRPTRSPTWATTRPTSTALPSCSTGCSAWEARAMRRRPRTWPASCASAGARPSTRCSRPGRPSCAALSSSSATSSSRRPERWRRCSWTPTCPRPGSGGS
nr:DUF3375 family protein [Luteimicrobium album]